MLHRITICIVSLIAFLVLPGNTAAVPQDGALVFDLVRIRTTNDNLTNDNFHAKRDGTVAVEQLQQKRHRLGINLTLKGVKYLLSIDTGSTDTWIAQSDFKCIDPKQKVISQKDCGMGPNTHKGSIDAIAMDDFSIEYGGGESAKGKMSKQTIEIGGSQVENVWIAFAHELAWRGDGLTVGIFGIAWDIKEPAIWQQFCEQQCPSLPMQFTLAINRDEDGDDGGSIAFGGTLDGQLITPKAGWVTVDLVDTAAGEWVIKRFEWGFEHNGNVDKEEIVQDTIIDSGNPTIQLPKETFAKFLSTWSPLPTWNTDLGLLQLDCKAKGPDSLYIEIGGTKFKIPVKNNILGKYDDICFLAVDTRNEGDRVSLGLPFMRHVTVHHDLDNRKISFKQRVYTT
ncbi:aspartic peptidase domain-containing protein [Massariosphaeria phaeospora]|uniref:Aspartic peptidase domain-containing protein n=1 Tax=Massariosphaeria phaeospora TaxID=100035 RepID=A0A7C8I6D6_9PLEO|nr:aspartic peptidase domain-containing protein [Massariosphaeria phaeospora]